jgi:ABC transporter DrrB family efflux protein
MTAVSEPTTAATGAPASHADADLPRGIRWTVHDSWHEAMRHIRALPRNVDAFVFATMQPIMFVLLFRYVFGGSIRIPGFSYNQYLMPGIFAQTAVFGSTFTAVGIAEDMTKGFIDRLRSLPISQPAVLIGRTLSDTLRNIVTFTVMLAVAFAIGFRFDGGLVRGLLATLLILYFSYAFSWIQALIGMSVKSVEAANSAGFIWMFPMTFMSSAFVSTETMTPWLRRVANANPFTIATDAARALYNGRDPGDSLWQALLWATGIIAVFSFLAIRRFESKSH